jgi:uncharacterized protein YqeY
MPTLTERLESDYKTALKAGQRLRVDTLRLIKAAVQRAAIEKRKPSLDDSEIAQVIGQQAKLRRETIESAKQTNRQDVLSQATEELAILTSYLPEPLSEDELKRLIEEAVGSVGAAQQGPIMKYVMGKAAGAADGKAVSRLVAERLRQR